MAKGGYKGNSPARETSPEEYSGVWDIVEQYGEQKAGSWPFQADDCAPKSLRFYGANDAYLSRTPSASGNRKVWTWSSWVKLHNVSYQNLFANLAGNTNGLYVYFSTDGKLYLNDYSLSGGASLSTTRVFRDHAAWMSLVLIYNTTEPNSSDRVKLFINGIQETLTGGFPNQNVDGWWNNTATHFIGRQSDNVNSYNLNAQLSEVNFIDGQALSCEEFGFFDGQGIWQPKRFTGDYSSGPVYSSGLTASNGYHGSYPAPLAFDGSTTTRAGNNQSSGGGTLTLTKNITVANQIRVLTGIQNTVKINGTSIGTATGSDPAYVVSNAAYDVTEIVIEAPNSNGYRADLFAIEVDGVLLTDASVGRNSFHLDFSDGVKDQSGLGNDWTGNDVSIFSGSAVSRIWESTSTYTPSGGSPTDHWTIASGGGSATKTINDNYGDLFSEVLEPGKIYAFTTAWPNGDDNGGWWFGDSNANGLSGTHPNQGRGSNSLGQRGRSANPANDTAGAHGTFLAPNGLSSNGDANLSGFQSINPYGTTSIDWVVDRITNKVWAKVSSNSTWVKGGNPSDASSTPTFHLPATGNLYFGFVQYSSMSSPGATITSFSFSATDRADDILVDSPVNGNEASTGAGGERRGNYCCLNPLDSPGCTLTDGNLKISCGSSKNGRGTIWPSSGKWYFEFDITTYGNPYVGIGSHGLPQHYVSKNSIAVNNTGSIYVSTDGTQTYPGFSVALNATGSYMCAFDLDNGKIWWGKDGTWYKQHTSANTTTTKAEVEAGNGGTVFSGHPNFGEEWTVQFGTSSNTSVYELNTGQKPFKYPSSVPSGFSPIATSFLPEPSDLVKVPTEAMDVVLWTGNGATQKIDNLKFSPDFLWLKCRNVGHNHHIFDTLRGNTKLLIPNTNGSELTYTNALTSFNDDGFEVGNFSTINTLNNTHVGWAWDAGQATTTISAGALNNSAYETSQTWSDNITTTGNGGNWSSTAGIAKDKAFNGNDANYAHANANGSAAAVVTLTFSPALACSQSVSFLGGVTSSGTGTISINGGAASSLVNAGTNPNATHKTTVNFTGNISTITITKTSTGAQGLLVYGFEVDDARLVDSGTSGLPNVPSTAADVRARPDAGFSMVFWQAQSSAVTVPHGIDKPEFIIMKSPNVSGSPWLVYHEGLGSSYYLDISATAASANNLVYTDAPTSNVFSPGDGIVNTSSYGQMVAYCWSGVKGFSKFGSFQNHSSSEGAFVFLGFKPALIMAKCVLNISSSSGAGDWIIKDTARSPFNNPSDGNTLVANVANAEDNYYAGTQAAIDILSNGFKIRHPNSSPLGDPGRLFIYAAWAENPFASNNRAV